MTPAGVFPIGEAFYIEEKPKTGLSTFQITENTYWVDDEDSELYNQRIELDGEKTWQSAERMIEYTDAYKYGFVVVRRFSSMWGSSRHWDALQQRRIWCLHIWQNYRKICTRIS